MITIGTVGKISSGLGGVFTVKCTRITNGNYRWKVQNHGWESIVYTLTEEESKKRIKIEK